MIATLDANVLVNAADGREPNKQAASARMILTLARQGGAIGLQTIGEFQAVLRRKLKRPSWDVTQAARNVMAAFKTFAYDASDVSRAITEAATGRFSYWDALLLSAAERHGIRFLVSEDMADGMRLGRIEVVQAFADGQISPRAAQALGMH